MGYMKKKDVKRNSQEKKWATAKKSEVFCWIGEAMMLRDLEQAKNLVLFSPRFKKEEKGLLNKLIDSAALVYEHKYLGYARD